MRVRYEGTLCAPNPARKRRRRRGIDTFRYFGRHRQCRRRKPYAAAAQVYAPEGAELSRSPLNPVP